MTPDPSTDVQLRTHVFTAPLREFGSEGKHWSPCASTLVTGETEAVLTDTATVTPIDAPTDGGFIAVHRVPLPRCR